VTKPVQVATLIEALKRVRPLDANNDVPDALPDAAMSDPLDTLLDATTLGAIRTMIGDDGEDGFADLVSYFLDDAPRLLNAMQDALNTNDAGALQIAAHTMKSTTALFGATALAALCEALERQGATGLLDGAQAHIDGIRDAYADVERAMHRLIAPATLRVSA
jgi:HPt (histidine-containing phosphotransfer) domain-containing protein